MGTRVQLPAGCSGITCADGTRYSGTKGGSVEVSDRHAKAIRNQQGTAAKMLTATGAVNLGTKKGRWCINCQPARIWQAWSDVCPRCGYETVPDNYFQER